MERGPSPGAVVGLTNVTFRRSGRRCCTSRLGNAVPSWRIGGTLVGTLVSPTGVMRSLSWTHPGSIRRARSSVRTNAPVWPPSFSTLSPVCRGVQCLATRQLKKFQSRAILRLQQSSLRPSCLQCRLLRQQLTRSTSAGIESWQSTATPLGAVGAVQPGWVLDHRPTAWPAVLALRAS